MLKRSVTSIGSALAMTFGLVVASQAQGANPDVQAAPSGCTVMGDYEVCTTDPETHGEQDLTIVNRLIDYIKGTTSGTIRGAMFLWEVDGAPKSQELIEEIINAESRGVDVDLIVGNPDNRNDDAIQDLRDAEVGVKVCTSGCLPGVTGGLGGVMHMKFFTFSANEQVVHTSSNLSGGQFQRHQNLLSITGDAKLYDNYVGYWNRMKENSWTYSGDTWSGTERARDGSVDGTKSYFYPRTEADPVAGTLEKLSCENDGRVWVAASLFHGDTRIPVRDQLIRLKNAGCDVRVIVASGDDKEYVMTASGLGDAEVNVLDGTDAAWESHHNKLIVTDANYEGAARTAVYAGSHNLNYGSLRESSDGMLRVTNGDVFNVYADYYDYMWELSKAH